jgi:biopolymer transport protein ExbB
MHPPILAFFELMGLGPMELFLEGGPIMWPIALVSFLGLTVSIERVLFIARESRMRDPELVEKMIHECEAGNAEAAIKLGRGSKDYLARVITEALQERHTSFSEAYIRASNRELTRFSQGLPIIDTVVTAAPLLGLLGTVTGMMATFGALGEGGNIAESSAEITGGVGEALIATMCGLAIAIMGLLPFNYMNARVEQARHEVEDAANALEVIFKKPETGGTTA